MRLFACVALVVAMASACLAESVNVLTLGVRNDGTEDVSAIVNAATERSALYFPAGLYKVAHPLRLRNPVRGEGYCRAGKPDMTRTWFVSALEGATPRTGVIEFGGPRPMNVEDLNVRCSGDESAILVTNCHQLTSAFLSRLGLHNVRGTAIHVSGGGSRPMFIQDVTVLGNRDYPPESTGIFLDWGVVDCRLSNIEIMGTRIGLVVRNQHTYGNNLHIWTGCLKGRDDGTWWKGTRSIVLENGAKLSLSQVYPDTSYYAIEQRGRIGYCDISGIMYWEDGSIKVSPARDGRFYFREPGSEAILTVHGGLVGVGGKDGKTCWTDDFTCDGADFRDVMVKSCWKVAPENLTKLCVGNQMPDYEVRYTDVGWCKVADILAVAQTGSCEGLLSTEDGARWKVSAWRGADGVLRTKVEKDNELAPEDGVRAVVGTDHVKVYVRSLSAEPLIARFTTLAMGRRFRPVDHGHLRNYDGFSVYREVLPAEHDKTP